MHVKSENGILCPECRLPPDSSHNLLSETIKLDIDSAMAVG